MHNKTTILSIHLLFVCLIFLGITSGTIYSQNVDVYLDSTAQFIRGFGAANIVDWYGDDLTLEDVERAYGNEDGQLGFNILRLRISPNPDDWDNGNQIETARKASEMGAIVWAAPWNPPASMYDPNSAQRKVDPAKYDLYAAHLDSFNTYMTNNGVPIYAISVQNEPDYANDWTAWDPQDIVTFLQDYAPSINTRVMAPESFQFRRNYSDPILNDSLAAAHTDIIGGHIYGGGTARYPLAEQKEKEVWMTEHYTSSDRSANIWPDALLVGSEIQNVMEAGWNAYIWWQIKRYYSPIHDGVDVVEAGQDYSDRGTSGSLTKRGYVMSQFARFVRPGYHRVNTVGPLGRGYIRVTVTAYKDSIDSKFVLVAVNDESNDKEVDINFSGATTTTFKRYITDDDHDAEEIDSLKVSGNLLSTTLPAKSITTFISTNYIPITTSNESISHPTSYKLEQNYPNPFNPSTTISYVIPEANLVSLKVFDLLGREVASLVDGMQTAGEHQAQFDASKLSSGVYIYKLESGSFVSTKKMLLIK